MQLKIKRSQEMKGFLGKTAHFSIAFRVQFTPEEKALIEKYKLGGTVLTPLELEGWQWDLTCNAAEKGDSIECKSLGALLNAEKLVKDACEQLQTYLQVAKSFDGTEVVHEFA